MKVAIINPTSGGLSGGYRKYLQKLVPLLQTSPQVNHVTVFIPPEINGLSGLSPGSLLTWPAADRRYGYPWVKAQLRGLAPDVVFIPTGRWLDCRPKPTVVMVRNMEPLIVPFGGNSLLEGVKNIARAYATKRACQRATRVIAVSRYVRDILIGKWKIEAQKIGLVYHGVETPPARAEAVKPTVLDRKDLGHFIFMAGSIRPARGVEDVVRAMPLVLNHNAATVLVIAGKPDPGTRFYQEYLHRLAHKLGVATHTIWAGHLNALEMAWCFINCAVFVMTSRAEACPNIALEALSHGCLIVSTAQSPMPEFFNGSALYYRPKDADDLASQIKSALIAPTEQRAAWQRAAQTRANSFKWLETARRTIAQLELAISMLPSISRGRRKLSTAT